MCRTLAHSCPWGVMIMVQMKVPPPSPSPPAPGSDQSATLGFFLWIKLHFRTVCLQLAKTLHDDDDLGSMCVCLPSLSDQLCDVTKGTCFVTLKAFK